MKENPSPIKEWLLPEGKSFNDIFNDQERRRGFPRIKHHRSGRKANMCLKFAATGGCPRGVMCNMAHYNTPNLDSEVILKGNARFKEVYKA